MKKMTSGNNSRWSVCANYVALLALATTILFASLPAWATWTVTVDGSTPEVSDGHWTIKLNNKKSAAFVSTDGATTLLDMTTLNADLAAEGKTYKCTEFGANAFRGASYSDLVNGLTEIRFPDEVTQIGQQCFQRCEKLVTVELGTSFAKFANSHGFSNCKSLLTVYVRGETPVVGTVHLPDAVPSLPNYTFENCNQFQHLVARGVKSCGQASVYQCALLESVELSPQLYAVTSGSDQGAFYMDWVLSSFFPSNMVLTSNIGQSCFRELPLDHDLDFSASTFTSIASSGFYGIKLAEGKRITLPATLSSLGSSAFRQQQNGRTYIVQLRFLGEMPTTLGSDCLTPRSAGYHNILYVDARKCPSWTATSFTSVEDDPSLLNEPSYPGENTLGKSTAGVNQSGWWNWLVQENLPKGDVYWEVAGEDVQGVITVESKDGYWMLELVPDGTGAYLARCVSATSPSPMELNLGQIEDDTDLSLAGLLPNAFANCAKLSSVTLPAGANAVGAHAFSNCTALATCVLSGTFSWNDVGAGAFEGCSALSKLGLSSQTVMDGALVLPSAATVLPEAVFAGCTSLTSFSAPGLSSVPARAFDGCSSLASVSFASDIGALSTYGAAAFRGTAISQTIDFSGTSIATIPDSLFENCTHVSLVKLPATVTQVGVAAFKNLAPGANVSFAGTPPTFGSLAIQPPADAAGSRYVVRVEYANLAAWQVSGYTATTDAMKEDPDYIGPSMFGRTTLGTDGTTGNWLFSLDPDLVWWISGKSSYKRLDNSQTVETTVATDGENEIHVFTADGTVYLAPKAIAQDGILDMTTLNHDTELMPTVLAYHAFYRTSEIVEVMLPDSIVSFGAGVFQECSTIQAVEAGENFSSFGSSNPFREANAFATFWKRGSERVDGLVAIPEEITALPESAFFNCDGVMEVFAPGVVSLGHSCFYHDGSLTNAVFSSDINTIGNGGNGVFYQCGNLRTISPSEMKLSTVGSDAFRELLLTHGLDFSKSTFTWIGTRAFFGIRCEDENGKPLPIVLPKTVTTINEQGFHYYNPAGNKPRLLVFLGDKPPTIGANGLNPGTNAAGKRYFIVADVARNPAWMAEDFTPLSEEDKAASDYPPRYFRGRNDYPGGVVLGWLASGTDGKQYKNWLIQSKSHGTFIVLR